MSETQTAFRYVVENRVALVTIDRPPLNILPGEQYRALVSTVARLVETREARAVVITGSAKAFVSGLDINDINAIRTPEENTRFTMEIKALFRQLEKLSRPVIAAIDGNCFGGGLELALACHLRFASREAKLALPEINIGTIPSFGGTQRLTRAIGRSRALDMLLTGRTVKGEEAYNIGLVNRVCTSAELVEQATGLAGQIAEKNFEAVEAVMRASVDGLEMDFDAGIAYESEVSSRLTGTYNMKEAMAAFFERRRPVFKNEGEG